MLILDESGATAAAEIIKQGGLAAFPTETVYGLGADAFNTAALARVFEVKGRPRFDPLIIHIADSGGLERTARLSALDAERRALLEKLAAAFWPGPLTLVLPKQPELPGLATAGLPTAAIRFPAHSAARALIRLSGGSLSGAVAAPSANPFGRLSPTRAEHVIEGLGEKIDCIIDGGPCSIGIESTVLDLSSETVTILRPGGVSREAIEAVTGRRVLFSHEPQTFAAAGSTVIGEKAAGMISPGMLKSHYAPDVPLLLHPPGEMARLSGKENEAYLFFSEKSRDAWRETAAAGVCGMETVSHPAAVRAVLTLSRAGSLLEAAANLFDCLHRLDDLKPARIHAEELPGEGLGAAVNDRLRRASVCPGGEAG